MVTELIENIFKSRLEKLENLKGSRVLVSVSGGSDSMALLNLTLRFSPVYDYRVAVCTVNHKIRPEEESGGDADFVEEYCRLRKVYCRRIDLKPDELQDVISRRQGGLEDGARFLRYKILENLKEELDAEYIFLGHNKNDQLETLLMRFLQGSGASGKNGISFFRECFNRPLLEVDKKQIFEYLSDKNIKYRVDKTNGDISYLRNRIRNVLVPVLNDSFPGWDSGLISGAEKAFDEETALDCYPGMPAWEPVFSGEKASFLRVSGEDFSRLPKAIRIRLLFRGCNLLCDRERVSYPLIESFAVKIRDSAFSSGGNFTAGFAGEWYYLGLLLEKSMEKSYSFVIRPGDALTVNDVLFRAFSSGEIENLNKGIQGKKTHIIGYLGPFSGGVSIQNCKKGGSIVFSNGIERLYKKLLSGEGVPPVLRPYVPCFQAFLESGDCVTGILGSVFGFRNWISVPCPSLFSKDFSEDIGKDKSGTYILIARII